MKIRTKLVIGFAIVAGLIIPTTVFSLYTYHEMHELYGELPRDIIPGTVTITEMDSALNEAQVHLIKYFVHVADETAGQAAAAEEGAKARSILMGLQKAGLHYLELEKHIGPQDEAQAEELIERIERLCSTIVRIFELTRQGAIHDEILDIEKKKIDPEIVALGEYLRKLKAIHLERLAEGEKAVHQMYVAGTGVVITAGVCAIVAAIVAAFAATRSVTKPLRALQEGTKILASGDLDYRIDMERKDEIGQLANDFDLMSENLSKTLISKRALEQANQQLAFEIEDRKQAQDDLKQNMTQLERFNRLAVGRELRMVELKQEVNDLLMQLSCKDEHTKTTDDSGTDQTAALRSW